MMITSLTITTLTLLLFFSKIKGDDVIPFTASTCNRIKVTISGDLNFTSGVYRRNSSREYFSHECRSLHLYKVHDSAMWVIGPKVGTKRGYVMTEDLSDDSIWKRWNGQLWINDVSISTKCDDTCHTFHLGGNIPLTLSGSYTRDSNNHNGLPVYRRNEMNSSMLYLYHNVSPCPHWAVGSSVGDTKVYLFSFSTQANVLHADDWRVNRINGHSQVQISLECREILNTSAATCGQEQRSLKADAFIVNGADAKKGEWPFMVSYKQKEGSHKCGAVILSRRWILTAGHCVPKGDESERTMVQVGVHDMQSPGDDSVLYAVRRTLHHPKFQWNTNNFKLFNDIGLIELHSDLIYNDIIQPVCLPSVTHDSFSFPGSLTNFSSCFLIGWGEQWYKGPPGVLQKSRVVSIADVDQCATHRIFRLHLEWMREANSLCVQTERGGRICKGDSGSPLLCEKEGRWFVMGVASWSLSQCYTYVMGIPSIYEHTAPWVNWIQRYIG